MPSGTDPHWKRLGRDVKTPAGSAFILLVAVFGGVVGVSPVRAQNDEDDASRTERGGDAGETADPPPMTQEVATRAMRQFDAFGEQLKRLGDWNQYADDLDGLFEDIWKKNNWNSEPDQFAKRLMREVERIPPWQVTERLDRFTDLLGERYQFNMVQRTKFKTRVYAESFGLILGHSDVIAKQLREFVERESSGGPITPEMVRRWTEESEPLMQDMLTRVERLADSARSSMKPEQAKLFDQDYERFFRRMDYIHQLRNKWRHGKWEPADWGAFGGATAKSDAPGAEQQPAAPMGEVPAGIDPKAPRVVEAERRMNVVRSYVAEDASSWGRWVQWFVAVYELDAGQRDAIQSILTELEARAGRFRTQHEQELVAVQPADRESSEAFQPLRDMFEELKTRSMALLTERQRATSVVPSEPIVDEAGAAQPVKPRPKKD
ncbi:MAG: hypothetical protein HOP29_20190 [Phycisphaerales bacterium]|nr:hypothetical protein [Phycisphaerales bacterium]